MLLRLNACKLKPWWKLHEDVSLIKNLDVHIPLKSHFESHLSWSLKRRIQWVKGAHLHSDHSGCTVENDSVGTSIHVAGDLSALHVDQTTQKVQRSPKSVQINKFRSLPDAFENTNIRWEKKKCSLLNINDYNSRAESITDPNDFSDGFLIVILAQIY